MRYIVDFIRRIVGVSGLQQSINAVLQKIDALPSHVNRNATAPASLTSTLPSSRNEVRAFVARSFLRGNGIEIGAFASPLAVPPGACVRYVDKYCRSDLSASHTVVGLTLTDFGIAFDSIIDPDIVDDGETLSKIGDLSQDFVIANHVLEHFEDPVKGFKNMLRVLKHDGVLYLSLPEMRHSFDRVRQETSLEHVLQDYNLGPHLSRKQAYLEFSSLFVQNGMDKGLFEKKHGDALSNFVADVAQELDSKDYSIHFHAWTSRGMIEMFNALRSTVEMPYEISFLTVNEDEVIFIFTKKTGVCRAH